MVDKEKYGKYALYAERETNPDILKIYRDYKLRWDKVEEIYQTRCELYNDVTIYRENLGNSDTLEDAEVELKRIKLATARIKKLDEDYERERENLKKIDRVIKSARAARLDIQEV